MKIKTALKYYYMPVRVAKIEKKKKLLKTPNTDRD